MSFLCNHTYLAIGNTNLYFIEFNTGKFGVCVGLTSAQLVNVHILLTIQVAERSVRVLRHRLVLAAHE